MGNKTIIIINELYFIFMAENSIILAVGTLKNSPCGFKQVYVFQFFVGKKTYPFIYVLLPGRNEKNYEKSFERIKRIFNISKWKYFVIVFFNGAD
jgi:hypothetical protein